MPQVQIFWLTEAEFFSAFGPRRMGRGGGGGEGGKMRLYGLFGGASMYPHAKYAAN